MCENNRIAMHDVLLLEPMKGIEPLTTVYKTVVLPLNYIGTTQHSNHFCFGFFDLPVLQPRQDRLVSLHLSSPIFYHYYAESCYSIALSQFPDCEDFIL